MAVCNWDPKKHGGKPCPIHGSGAVEGREERKNRREELKKTKDQYPADALKTRKEINEKYGRKSSEKYNIGSNKKLQGEERQKMQDLVDAFNEIGVKAELKDGWEDYGAKMEWTAPVADGTWLLYPSDWIRYMNGEESIQDIIEDYAEGHNIDIDKGVLESFDDDYEEEFNDEYYTKEELWDKFGTTDLDIINAGSEKNIKLKDENEEDKPYDFDKWAKETNSDKTQHRGYIDTNKTYKPEEIMDIVSGDDDFDVIAGGGLDGNVWFKHKSGPHYVWNRQSGKIKLLSKNATNRYEGI